MQSRIKVLSIAGLVAVIFITLAGCFLPAPDIETAGTWHCQGAGWESKYVITNDLFEVYSSFDAAVPDYTYEIVEYSNSLFNEGELGEGDYGSAVIKYLDPPTWNPDASGHTILRWQNLETSGGVTRVDLSEGFYDPDGDFSAEYFATPDEAKEYITAENGSFSVYSQDCERQ